MKIAVSPGSTATSNPPWSFAVTVCGALSAFVSVTIDPGLTVVGTSNLKFRIVITEVAACADPSADDLGEPAEGVAGVFPLPAAHPVIPPKAMATVTARIQEEAFMAIPFRRDASVARRMAGLQETTLCALFVAPGLQDGGSVRHRKGHNHHPGVGGAQLVVPA